MPFKWFTERRFRVPESLIKEMPKGFDPRNSFSVLVSDRQRLLLGITCCRYFFCKPHGGNPRIDVQILQPMEVYADGADEETRLASESAALDLDDYTFYATHQRDALISLSAVPFSLDACWDALTEFVASQGCYGNELNQVGYLCICDLNSTPNCSPLIVGAEGPNNSCFCLARQIYDNGRFGRLPVLAAKLASSGYPDSNVIAHLRQPGIHIRGCWALDHLLGF